MNNEMIIKYAEYLKALEKRLDEYFHEQKEFLYCKAGCGLCCKLCYYPVSRLEYEYMKIGAEKIFNEEQKERINLKAIGIMKDRKEFLKRNSNIMDFYYECPYLIDDSCANYEHRALLCRSHGVIYKDIANPNKINLPYCFRLGLNYFNVWDNELKDFSEEKMQQLGITSRPKAYDLSYSVLRDEAGELDYGDTRMLVEWIFMDIPNHEDLLKN